MTEIILVGCGRMGSALRTTWEKAGFSVICIDPHAPQCYADIDALPNHTTADVIVFAVKPQALEPLLPAYAARFGIQPLYLSVAAGKELSFYTPLLGPNIRFIRAMPNTPALVGYGMTALLSNTSTTAEDRALADRLFAAVGAIYWAENEVLMHAITALSGSGPAYVFLLLEVLSEAAVALGLPLKAAQYLASQTVIGAGMMARQDTDFVQLRKNVTSPGGTTEAALNVLIHDNALLQLFQNALLAAVQRSHELAEK